jgi:outer membrane beta-barrel protein
VNGYVWRTCMKTSLLIALLLASTVAFGQSRQYQRSRPKAATTKSSDKTPDKTADKSANSKAAYSPGAAVPAKGAVTNTPAPVVESAPGEKKVDVSDLEKKYWVPKDTEFQVVQNRTYSKAKRLAVTLSMGTLLGDYYSNVRTYNLTANYYFSERHGVQVQYIRFDSGDNETVDYFRSNYGNVPDFGRSKSYFGMSYNWIPIYAKLSLLEQQIIYFDMSISPGLGLTQYDQIFVGQDPGKKTAPTLALDIAQHFYLNQNWALRFDFINHLFNEEVRGARDSSVVKKTKLNHTIIIQGGITFHF